MPLRPLAPVVDIVVAIVAAAIGLVAKWLLARAGIDTLYLPLVLPVAAVAWRLGGPAGILTTLIAGLGDLWLFHPGSLTAPTRQDIIELGAFLIVGVTISGFAGLRLRTMRRAAATQEAGFRARAEAEQALERLAGLERLLERLGPATTPEQVADTILAHAVALVGSDAGAVVVLSSERGRARVFTAGERGPASSELVVHERRALADVLMLGRPIWQHAAGASVTTPAGDPQVIVPLRGRGPVIGALALHWRAAWSPDPPARGFVEAVASQCGQALERALLFDAERHLRRDTEQSREEAVRLRDELRAVLQSIGEPILVVAPSGTVTLANQAAELLLGPVADVDELRSRLRSVDGADLAFDAGRVFEARLEGSDRVLRTTIFGVRGRPSGSRVLAIRDVTELRRAEEAREVFIGVLSHELRTPVTTILGGIDLLARDLPEPDRRVVMEDVAAESERLRRLVEDVLVLSRFERDAIQVEDEPVLVHHIVAATATQEAKRTDPPADVRVHIAGDLPPVRADATYLEQILRNLIGNAVKYGASAGPVTVGAESRGDRVEVTVADGGPGFPAADSERLFELFYRSDRTASKPGAGIGLFVARQLARSMGGELSARPRRGGGAEFVLSLRAFEAPEELLPEPADDGREILAASGDRVVH